MTGTGDNASYLPAPLDTSGVELGPELESLLERLAENIHENWAQGRLEAGWRFGATRNDAARETPCLVPYAELPESEKNFDRRTVEQSLKAILKIGFGIVPPTSDGVGAFPESAPSALAGEFEYAKADHFWKSRDPRIWKRNPSWYMDFGNILLKKGEALFAYDVFTEACCAISDPAWSDRLRLRRAFAMAESGAAAEAVGLLEGPVSPDLAQERWETLGRLHKDLSVTAEDAKERSLHGETASAHYAAGYEHAMSHGNLPSAHYCAINVATLRLFQGQLEESRDWTRRVRTVCEPFSRDDSGDFWLEATLAEAALLDGSLEKAASGYAKAVAGADGDLRALRSMARQALRIAQRLGIEAEKVASWFQLRADACLLRTGFPDASGGALAPIGAVYAALSDSEDAHRIARLLEEGASELHLVLPFPVETTVRDLPVADAELVRGLATRAASVDCVIKTPGSRTDNVQEFARLAALGKARLRSQSTFPLLYVSEGNGGFVAVPPDALDPAWSEVHTHPSPGTDGHAFNYLPLLFADVKGFSKLGDLQIETFVQRFWALVHGVSVPHRNEILQAQTAGDGLFMVFRSLSVAAAFGLSLAERFRSEDWESHGLPTGLSIRVSLDCGPCASYPNPVSQDHCFCGSVVNRAARIEPVTPPGKVYVSDAFVYASLALGLQGYDFSYAGRTALPKGSGVLPLFHLRRTPGAQSTRQGGS